MRCKADSRFAAWLRDCPPRAVGPLLAALVAGTGLAGCASMSERLTERLAEAPGIGLPSGAPERPSAPPAYPAVHDMPPPRQAAVLNELELQKMESDLIAARDSQQPAAAPSGAALKAAKKKPAPVRPAATPAALPVSSSRSIY